MTVKKNLTVKDLKDILAQCPDDMPVIIPVIDEDDCNNIYGFRYVRTAGILSCESEAPKNRIVLCLNAATDSDISSQVKNKDAVCEKVLV